MKTRFEEMMDRLPSNIKETEVLRFQSKKVLAALLELLLHSEARTSRVIYCQNSRLRKIAGVGYNDLRPAINQLIDYELITRRVGTGEGDASEYTINLKKLKEPLKEKSFDDLYGELMEEPESPETPNSSTITTTITIPITTSISTTTSTSISTPITTSMSTPITTSMSTSNEISNWRKEYDKHYDILYSLLNDKLNGVSFKEVNDLGNKIIEEYIRDNQLDNFSKVKDLRISANRIVENINEKAITKSFQEKME